MLQIKDQIFMGNGETSLAYVGDLFLKLNRAIKILGDIQQPSMTTDSPESCEIHKEEIALSKVELRRIAREIYLGLTGEQPWESK